MNTTVLIVSTLACLSLYGSEVRVEKKDLPVAVQGTIAKETSNATVKRFSKEIEKGRTLYEAETTVNGKSRDLLVDPDGKVVEVESEVDLSSLPPAAQSTLRAAAGASKITKVESVVKAGRTTYEATIHKGTKNTEVAVDGKGRRVDED